ncbi:hypothetical protein OPKNFCMD_6815 [Methylobacterium crusticola]|uniref:HTH luxR-type domain-containing protein n=1 Tax=Methylobacterium crusticola TaxID=1697972 RepID=A0ABQ4RA27_9HYPH|nr:LuxR C-terminal-related transcriptional regulator [Methylobacterium crusticola]GJD54035.1 hypothetical protein OPKNFCMD_6815 [Methylobacterium crusticola]
MPASEADYGDLIDAIYEAAAAPELWSRTLVQVADYVGAAGGMLAFHDPSGPGSFIITGRLREDLDRLYIKQYTRNPYAVALARAPANRLILANSLVDVAEVRRTAFHADILAPQAISEMLVAVHPSLTQRGSSGGVSFALTQAQSDYRDEIATRMRRLVPHLARAIDLSLQVGRPSAKASEAASLLDALSGPMLLVDARGRIVLANRDAEALLSQVDGLSVGSPDHSVLCASLGSETRKLAGLINACLTVNVEGHRHPGAVRVTRPSGKPGFLVVATPLPAALTASWGALQQARALIQIVDPAAALELQAALLGQAMDLTQAQVRVAALISAGLSVPQAAELMKLAPTTVRTHLARCFEKTGTHSQVELARLVASLPAAVPSKRES